MPQESPLTEGDLDIVARVFEKRVALILDFAGSMTGQHRWIFAIDECFGAGLTPRDAMMEAAKDYEQAHPDFRASLLRRYSEARLLHSKVITAAPPSPN